MILALNDIRRAPPRRVVERRASSARIQVVEPVDVEVDNCLSDPGGLVLPGLPGERVAVLDSVIDIYVDVRLSRFRDQGWACRS